MDRGPAKQTDPAEAFLAELVREEIKRSLITEASVARAANIPASTFQRRLERGDFRPGELRRVARVLGANVVTWAAQAEAHTAGMRASA